jgi:hypothetical protein
MADGMAVESANAATFITNKEVKSEITCIRCAELELELVRTRIELKSAIKIAEMLREELLKDVASTEDSKPSVDQNFEIVLNKSTWKKTTTEKRENKKVRKVQQNQFIPITENKYATLTNLNSSTDNEDQPIPTVVNGVLSRNRNNNKKIDQKHRLKSKKHRVLLLGDSQMRGCADVLKKKLNSEFEISGIVKPGAKAKDVLGTKIDEGMSTNDVIVVCAATNDISKNEAKEGLRNIINFVKHNRHTNIIVMEILHRHDLVDWSCVNKEIEQFNRQLTKRLRLDDQVSISRLNLGRQHFTRHGMHINYKGKEVMCQQIAELIQQKIDTVNKALQLNMIPLNYEANIDQEATNPVEVTHQEYKEDTVHGEDTEAQGNKSEKASLDPSLKGAALPERDQRQQTRSSNRKRRPPVKISNDFL